MASNIFMGDRYKNMKFIKESSRMDEERDRVKDTHNSVKNKEFLINI